MTPPFRSPPSAAPAPVPRGCGGDSCVSPRDAWPLHHVRHDGVFCRLCSSCVLLYHPEAFCSACVHLLPHGAASASAGHHHDPAVSPPGPTAACSACGLFVAHVSCVPDPVSFVCPPCAAAAESMPFSFSPSPFSGAARRALDEPAARVLLVAARLAHESISRAAAAARKEAEAQVREAAVARKRAREMLDAAFRVLEAEAKDAKKLPAPQPQPKKKTPKVSHIDKDKLFKLNAIQQPALAFAAAAAAAAAAATKPVPSPKDDKKTAKQDAQGSSDRTAKDDKPGLFGALQS